jgi:hypothetical protein
MWLFTEETETVREEEYVQPHQSLRSKIWFLFSLFRSICKSMYLRIETSSDSKFIFPYHKAS